jgi:hypothetical protein
MNFSTHAKNGLETINGKFKKIENMNEEFLEFRGLREEKSFV